MRGLGRLRGIQVLLCIVAMLCGESRAQEQTTFHAEDTVRQQVTLPPAVAKLLAAEPDVHDSIRSEDTNAVPRGWYDATSVRLSPGPRDAALLVRGKCPLCGAHTAWFWIYGRRGGKWSLLLFVAADQVELLDRHHKGYRDVRASYVTASAARDVDYTFDGKMYQKAGAVRTK